MPVKEYIRGRVGGWLLVCLPPLCLLICYFCYARPLPLYPAGRLPLRVEVFTDADAGGNSRVLGLDYTPEGLVFTYRLEEGIEYPYVGLSLAFASGEPVSLRLQDYEALRLRCRHSESRPLDLVFQVLIPGITTLHDVASQGPLIRGLHPGPVMQTHVLSLAEFQLPGWWLEQTLPAGVRETTLQPGKVFSFEIHDTMNIAPLKDTGPLTLVVSSIALRKGTSVFLLPAASGLVVYYILLILFAARRSRRRKKQLPRQQPLGVGNMRDAELARIYAVMENHYNDPALSPAEVARQSGIPVYRISRLLKAEAGCSFTQLLNALRTAEARRLLVETDRRVTEIAFLVGFNSSAYFHKVFKSGEGLAPSDYRRKHR